MPISLIKMLACGCMRARNGPCSATHHLTMALIQTTDMTEEMQSVAVNTALDALEMYLSPGEIATFIKKSFDLQFHSGWLCVVGRSFGR